MRTFIVVIFTLMTISMFAQRDTEFWFVAPEAEANHGDSPIFLRLSGVGTNANVTISQPANPSFTPISQTVPANGITSIDLTSSITSIENKPANQVLNKGLLIQSNVEINAYYEIASGVNPEIFPLKGRNALGTSFYAVGQNLYQNQMGFEAIDIVATENNTQITITPTANIVGHSAGIPFTIVLNKGETFSCQGLSTAANVSLIGTYITSNKPIAITLSDDSLFNLGAWDIIGDQLVPISLTGTEYIAVAGLAADEELFCVATEDNTVITVHQSNGTTTSFNVNQGQYINTTMTGASIYISSNNPIYVYHISGHVGEIGSAVLPPIVCTGSDQMSFVRPGNDQFSMMVLTEAPHQNNFTLNGNTFNLNFLPVAGTTNWVAARIDPTIATVPIGNNRLENSSGLFHLGILYNYDGFSSEYGYFSNYSTLNIGDDRDICEGTVITLDAGNSNTNYQWSTGATSQTIAVSAEGMYTVQVDYFGCTLTDTMVLNVNEISVSVGDDIAMCVGSDTVVNATTQNTQVTYEWHDGSTQTFFNALDTGLISVTITDTIGCSATDTMLFSYHPVVELGNDTSFVCDSLSFYINGNLPNASYTWHDGSTDSFYLATSDGWFWVDVIDQYGCFSSDTLFVAFVNSPVLDLGNDTIVCPDEPVTIDATIPAGVGYLWQDNVNTSIYTTTEPGTYIVRAVDTTTCFIWDTLVVENFFVPDSLFETSDTILCNDETYELIPDIANPVSYSWQDGSTDPTFTITETGTFWVSIIDDNNCPSSDTVSVLYLSDPISDELPEDTTVCTGTSVLVNVYQESASAYQWTGQSAYFGQNDYQSDSFIMTIPGIYSVAITNPCGVIEQSIELIVKDCNCEPFVPNAFSPNNDGENDLFKIYETCPISNGELWIFDRSGALVYYTTTPLDGWDGLFQGRVAPPAVYVWQLRYEASDEFGNTVQHLLKGDVTVVR